MSFYTLSTNETASGNPEAAFAGVIRQVPNDTFAKAKVHSFTLVDNEYGKYYQIMWELVDTEFAGQQVRQKLEVWNEKPAKADRAKNMMVLLFKLFQFKPLHNNAPDNRDLEPVIGKIAGIKIQEWQFKGNTGNWVSEVHSAEGFQSKLGISLPSAPSAPEADFYGKPPAPAADEAFIDDDVPF